MAGNPYVKQLSIDGTLYDIYDEDAREALGDLDNLAIEIENVNTKATKADKYCLDFDISPGSPVVSLFAYTKETNSNFEIIGSSVREYYYIRVGKLVIVNFCVRCKSPRAYSDGNWVITASGLPPALNENVFFSLGAANADAGSLVGNITTSGSEAFARFCGGKANEMYFGQCIYFASTSH